MHHAPTYLSPARRQKTFPNLAAEKYFIIVKRYLNYLAFLKATFRRDGNCN